MEKLRSYQYLKNMELKKETEQNIKILVDIRDDAGTSPAVRIQAIQTMQKIIDNIGVAADGESPNADDIINKIRGAKK